MTILQEETDMANKELILLLKPILRLLEKGEVDDVISIIQEVLDEASSKK